MKHETRWTVGWLVDTRWTVLQPPICGEVFFSSPLTAHSPGFCPATRLPTQHLFLLFRLSHPRSKNSSPPLQTPAPTTTYETNLLKLPIPQSPGPGPMTIPETRNLLTNEPDPSEDEIDEGLAEYIPAAGDGFEGTRKPRDPWLIRMSHALQMRSRVAGAGFGGIIIKVSLLFGCTLLAIWVFWSSRILLARSSRLPVRHLSGHRATYGSFSQTNIGSTRIR